MRPFTLYPSHWYSGHHLRQPLSSLRSGGLVGLLIAAVLVPASASISSLPRPCQGSRQLGDGRRGCLHGRFEAARQKRRHDRRGLGAQAEWNGSELQWLPLLLPLPLLPSALQQQGALLLRHPCLCRFCQPNGRRYPVILVSRPIGAVRLFPACLADRS